MKAKFVSSLGEHFHVIFYILILTSVFPNTIYQKGDDLLRENKIYMDPYWGATRSELLKSRFTQKFLGNVHPSFRLPHKGTARLGSVLELSEWCTIRPEQVVSVYRTYDDVFTRFTLISQHKMAVLAGGEPLRMVLKEGTILYLMFNWSSLTGFTRNKEWLVLLHQWLSDHMVNDEVE